MTFQKQIYHQLAVGLKNKLNRNPFFWLLILYFISNPFELFSQCDRNRDSIALVRLYNSTKGVDWIRKNNWLISGSPLNTWYGVVTNAEGCVVELNLNSNRLEGPMPDEIIQLKEMVKLRLNDNKITLGVLTDSLPNGLSQWQKLEVLNLSSNLLGGPINQEIGQLTNLTELNLSLNYFNGKIPATFGNLKKITKIYVNQNSIVGPLPSNLGDMVNLEELILSQNKINGPLPVSIGSLSKLKIFSISQNLISGAIPVEMGQLSELQFLYMNENRITGSIPGAMGNLINLRELWLNNNQIIGSLPLEIGNLKALRRFIINNNQINGTIPDVLTSLTQLSTLILSHNQMTGTIPLSLTDLVNLESLLFDDNLFTGQLPVDMGKLIKLNNFQCQNNQLSGFLPSSLGSITTLRRLYFHNNNFEGCFPQTYRRFCNTVFNTNTNENGHNFSGNTELVFQGDFLQWCSQNYMPDAGFNTNAPLCEGNTLLLQPNDQTLQYNWSGPNNFSSMDMNPMIENFSGIHTGNYFLTVTDGRGCTSTSSKMVNIISGANIQVNTPICEGKTIQFTISPGLSYLWTGPNNFTSTDRNPSIPSATKEMEGVYQVQIFTNDCTIEKEILVELTTIGSVKQPDPVCLGNTLTLEASGGNLYNWSGPSGFSGSSSVVSIPQVKVENNGIYTVLVQDNTGCKSSYSVGVEIMLPEIPALDDLGFICPESFPKLLAADQGTYSGDWSGEGVEFINGFYFFNPMDVSGLTELTFTPGPSFTCVSEGKTQIYVHSLSLKVEELRPNTSEQDDNGAMIIQVNGTGNDFDISWEGPASGLKTKTGNGTIDVPDLPSGNYRIELTDENGCKVSDSVTVKNFYSSYFIPNAVSRNATLIENSFFSIYGKNINHYDIDVYDRWGSKVFTGKNLLANDFQNGWNVATTNLQSGVYLISLKIDMPAGEEKIIDTLTILD